MDKDNYSLDYELKKILQIKYKYGFLNQLMANNILQIVTILLIYKIMIKRQGLFRAKSRLLEGKNIRQRKRG